MKHRWLIGTAIAAFSVALPTGLAAATDDPPPDEAYPPAATTTIVVVPTTTPLARTGADGTDMWIKVGAGAILVGGVLVAATARRRHASSPAS